MGNHSKCFKCGELDEFCVCTSASTAASEQQATMSAARLSAIELTTAHHRGYQAGIEMGKALAADAASEQQASVSDEQIIAALHAEGIDTYPSKYGFNAVQVSGTTVPGLRKVFDRLAALSGRATIPSEADERINKRESIADNHDAMIILTQDYPREAKIRIVDAHTERNVQAALTHRATTATASEPVVYQFRTKPDWDERRDWSEWENCTKGKYEDCLRVSHLHNWRYEVRALCVIAAAPDTATTAEPQTAAQGDVARDAARYRVLREHVWPADVRITMRSIPPQGQSLEERIDMLCDQLVDAAMSAPATSKETP